jgi:hypothetical protein
MSGEMVSVLTGPVSALGLAVAILWGLSRFASKYLPQIIDKHLQQIDDQMECQRQICNRLDDMGTSMVEQTAQSTEAMRKAISGVHGRLNPIESDVKEIKSIVNLKREVPDGGN